MESVPNALAQPDAQLQAQAAPVARVLWDAPRPMRLWHLASLDAPTVAVVWSLAFAWAVHIRLPLWLVAVLALTTWAIYIADRLLDARKALRFDCVSILRDRHFFHWRHRRWFAPLSFFAVIGAAILVASRMAHASLPSGTVIAVAAFGYFARVHSSSGLAQPTPRPRRIAHNLILSKELLVGVLFTAGCLLPAWMRSAERPWPLALAAVFFAALAWLNCHAIEHWESQPWQLRPWRTGARSDSPNGVARDASIVALAGFFLALVFAATQPSAVRIAELLAAAAASCLLLALLDRLRHRITPLALRAAADLVLLTPLVLLLR